MRRATIREWLKQDTYHEQRGGRRNSIVKYGDTTIADRICILKQKRIDKGKYFVGSDHVRMDYAKTYPEDTLPKIWYIDKVVRNAGLQTRKPKKKRRKGGSEYLLYPIESIRNLGCVHQSADFIGKKYITGRSQPVNIFSSTYYVPFKLYEITRIPAEKAVYVTEQLEKRWRKYPIPNVFRMDNGLQFRGTASGKRALGMCLRFLLNLNVTPLFGSPSKPWTNPHVEGHNRVFNEKVWNTNFFKSLKEIDLACDEFNQESLELFHFKYDQFISNGNFKYIEKNQRVKTDKLESVRGKKICFTRFVESLDHDTNAFIVIMNETIQLPEKYTHQFVFVVWDIEKERLSIFSEYQKQHSCIKQIKFKLNL